MSAAAALNRNGLLHEGIEPVGRHDGENRHQSITDIGPELEQAGNRPTGRQRDREDFRPHKNRDPHEGDEFLRVDLPGSHTDNPV